MGVVADGSDVRVFWRRKKPFRPQSSDQAYHTLHSATLVLFYYKSPDHTNLYPNARALRTSQTTLGGVCGTPSAMASFVPG